MNKIRTPLVTVLVVAALGVILLVINQSQDPGVDPAAGPPGAAPPSAAAPASTEAAAEPVEAAYTGHTEGPRIAVAVAVEGDKAAGYLCDGAKVEAWLQGSRSGDTVQMQSRNGAYRLTGTVTDGKVDGEVVLASGRSYPFSTIVAGPPAGLYEQRANATDRTGWIVLPDGSQVGARTRDGVTTPAPPLDAASGTATVDGQDVRVATFDVGAGG